MSNDERELHLAWQRHVGTTPAANAWFDTVIGRHRSPNRHYHDVRHVRWVVHHVRELADATDPPLPDGDLDAAVAASFFHDAVYDATSTDNESSSARLAARALAEVGWQRAAIGRVVAMIAATAGHDPGDDTDPAIAIVVAADLAVLAAEPSRYGDYARAVRREFAHLDDEAWRAGRSAFIHTTLQRPHIFPPRLGLEQWERRARANLGAELAALA